MADTSLATPLYTGSHAPMIKRPAALSRSGRNSRMTSLGSGGSPQRERSRAALRSARRGSPGYICRARRHQWTRTRTDENSLELTSPVIEGSEGFDTVKMDGTEGEAARGAVKRGRRFGRWPRREGRVPFYKFAPVSKTTHDETILHGWNIRECSLGLALCPSPRSLVTAQL